MSVKSIFSNIYSGKTVLVTGHTGFKGSWLCCWLNYLGAEVIGYSLQDSPNNEHYNTLNIDVRDVYADVRDSKKLKDTIDEYSPEIIFHLAAQSLVRESYKNPSETFEVNTMGTMNVLEAARQNGNVKAIINITTDKVYENKELQYAYQEKDPLGGHDIYSSSKACSDILTSSFRKSFCNDEHSMLIASARAGNVIGGGDRAADRLIPDLIRAVENNNKTSIRSPHSVRPWQHVLDGLSGYLVLGSKLLASNNDRSLATAFNFGPDNSDQVTVGSVIEEASNVWELIQYELESINNNHPHEAKMLMLDISKSRTELNWEPVWNWKKAVGKTIEWYLKWHEEKQSISVDQLNEYIDDAIKNDVNWIEQ